MQVIDLFSGIGGFSLAARWMGWETVCFCEIEEFPRKVLAHHWPEVYCHNDVKTLSKDVIKEKTNWNSEKSTIVVGGFPCQPYSTAGKREGDNDNRALFPEMLRIIREIQPDWVVGENVTGLLSMENGKTFEQICASLESEGYSVQPFIIPACGIGAIHRRNRVWIVAERKDLRSEYRKEDYQIKNGGNSKDKQRRNQRIRGKSLRLGDGWTSPDSRRPSHEGIHARRSRKIGLHLAGNPLQETQWKEGSNGSGCNGFSNVADPQRKRLEGSGRTGRSVHKKPDREGKTSRFVNEIQWPTEPPVLFRNDGLPRKLVRHRNRIRKASIKAAGNAIVPQIAYQIFKAINLFR